MSCLFCIFAAHIKIQMETLYSNSLLVAWHLLFVFSFILLFGKVPDRDIYRSYNRTRRIVGVALGLFAIQILLQWLFNFRENTPLHAAGLNLTCYYPCWMNHTSAGVESYATLPNMPWPWCAFGYRLRSTLPRASWREQPFSCLRACGSPLFSLGHTDIRCV